MTNNEYIIEMGKMKASRRNEISYMVSAKVPKEEAGLKSDIEKMYFDDLMKQAKETEDKYGIWPVFEPEEIEYDDSVLDIYNTEV